MIVAVATILLAGMLWVILGNQLVTVQDHFEDMTPLDVNSTIHNRTTMIADYQKGESIFYFSMFALAGILLFAAVKITQEEKAIRGF